MAKEKSMTRKDEKGKEKDDMEKLYKKVLKL